MRRTVSVLTAVVGLTLLTGCSDSPERVDGAAKPVGGLTASATPATTPSIAASATTPAPSTAPTTKSASSQTTTKPAAPTTEATTTPATLVLGPNGLGALKLGMTAAQAKKTGLVSGTTPSEISGCNTDLRIKAADDADEAVVFVSDLGVVSITAYPGVATPEGIKLGSKTSAVKKAYPDWESVTSPDEEGRGYAKVPGNSKAVYNITILDGKLIHMNLQLRTQNCYE